MKLYKGIVIDTPEPSGFRVLENGHIVVENGTIISLTDGMPEGMSENSFEEVVDASGKLIIPGFVDIHVHAPQWCNAGIGFDLELLPWLEQYTFPAEAHFADPHFAAAEYERFLNELIRHGTTRACMFATKHLPAYKILAELAGQSGMCAYIGKVNMDRNSIPELEENAEQSLAETEEAIQWTAEIFEDRRIRYIVTPRFVPSTTDRLMDGLGALVERYQLPVQSHLDENRSEVAWVHELEPESRDFASVYADHGLMPEGRTIMAHCIHLKENEIRLLRERRVLCAHCAMSNADLASGLMPARRWLNAGLQVAIASDMGGSHSVNMREHIVDSMKVSKLCWFEHPDEKPLSFPEAFYMATRAGGRFFGNVGCFDPGNDFDALIVNDESLRTGIDHSSCERLERFIYLGESGCIEKRYCRGRELTRVSAERLSL